uniref:[F-actin]-monooxygenase MICAL1-3-like Rossman domain-containing protein n=1 Tax=Arcella intermedia TaxID=1963864 RepID=A0A6B2L3G4_9EUKA
MNKFKESESLDDILSSWQSVLDTVQAAPGQDVYTALKEKSYEIFWCRQLFQDIEKKRQHSDYDVPASNKNIVVIGAGPAGLLTAIECRMLGANVHVIEKRNYITRNNILHLWPFTVDYLKSLAAKVFYSKFGTGSINHIGTKYLQRILIKISLLIGINLNFGVEFLSKQNEGNKISINSNPSLQLPPIDILVGADGDGSVIVKEFEFSHAKKETFINVSLGITFNFVNNHSKEEMQLREFAISRQFAKDYFQSLKDKYGIDLENLVYYRGETHYFVMTPTKESLLNRQVFISNEDTTSQLISSNNISMDKLLSYVRDVANVVGIPESCEIEQTHTQSPDVAIFDFSRSKKTDEVVKVFFPQLVALVGDASLAPFWPQGTGCNRALLSALDTAWMFREIISKGKEDAQSLQDIVDQRAKSFTKMRTSLAESIRPFTKTSLNPDSRYGNGFTGIY